MLFNIDFFIDAISQDLNFYRAGNLERLFVNKKNEKPFFERLL